MNISRVVHCKKEKYDIYCGRPSIYGNIFSHKDVKDTIKCKTRIEAISNFRKWLLGLDFLDLEQERRKKILDNLSSLKNKILGCWCKPMACHCDVLIELLNNKQKDN